MPTEKNSCATQEERKRVDSKSQFSGKCNYPPRRPASAHAHSLAFGKGKKRPNERHEYTRTLVTYVVCMQRDIYIASREATCFI